MCSTVLYSFNSSEDYLIWKIIPNVFNLQGRVGDLSNHIIDKIKRHQISNFVFHINLSETHKFPIDREILIRKLLLKKVRIFNSSFQNTTKRNLQNLINSCGLNSVKPMVNGEMSDKVIIKTNHNFGGLQERKLSKTQRKQLDISTTSTLINYDNYKILNRDEIPQEYFNNESLQIENYISNSQNAFIRIYFCGDKFVLSKAYSEFEVMKMKPGIKRENYFGSFSDYQKVIFSSSEPECINALFESTKFIFYTKINFGALDLVFSNDGKCYIVDVNLTPFWGQENQTELCSHLQNGWNNLIK